MKKLNVSMSYSEELPMATKLKAKKEKPIFNGFLEYWHLIKTLSLHQRQIIFLSLSTDEQDQLEKSFKNGGWIDILRRNELNTYVEDMQTKYGLNLIEMKCKVLSGKSVYISKKFWDEIQLFLNGFRDEDKYFIIGNLKAIVCKNNTNVILVTKQDYKGEA